MLALFLLIVVSAVLALHHDSESSNSISDSSSSSSSDSHRGPPPEPLGACCFEDKCLGNDYTSSSCHYVWAGPNTTRDDCEHKKPCCFKHEHSDRPGGQNEGLGRCSLEQCFDCIKKGGQQVQICTDCRHEATTTRKPSPTHHRPSTTTLPRETTTPPSHRGCCCHKNGTPNVCEPHECHGNGGVYRGDGTTCEEDHICDSQCCHVSTGDRQPHQCPRNFDENEWQFITYGSNCAPESCGVTCCINANAIDVPSSRQCEANGGVAFPNISLSNAKNSGLCGGGCCHNLTFTVTANASQCTTGEPNGTWLGSGVGYCPGVCGGACCVQEGQCTIQNITSCGQLHGVYQGDDVICGDIVVHDDDDDDEEEEEDDDDDTSEEHSRSHSSEHSDSENRKRSEHSSSDHEPENLNVCANDGCCCLQNSSSPWGGRGQSLLVAHSRECYKHRGVFLGEGTNCERDSCKGGVCCCEGVFGGQLVNNKAECDLLHGIYAGDGSRLDFPGVCNSKGGACLCDDQCIEVPNAETCTKINGKSFRGVGSRCTDDGIHLPDDDDDEGSCCVPKSGRNDESQCRLTPSRTRCAFLGGHWNGVGSKCTDQICQEIRGACCHGNNDDAEQSCEDRLTLKNCRERNGRWAAEALCDDEYSCSSSDHGACCRDGFDCTSTTVTACRRVGGRFQGFESTCNDIDGQICKRCVPCEEHAPDCDDKRSCANPNAVCVREYGKCMVIAVPFGQSYDESSSDSDAPTTTTGHHHHHRSHPPSTTSHAHESETNGHHYHHRKRDVEGHGPDEDFSGPLSCGVDTVGLPCLAKPLFGKCRIGTCTATTQIISKRNVDESSDQSSGAEVACIGIREYPCGCECDGAWLKKCASLSGRVLEKMEHHEDGEGNGQDEGIAMANVEVLREDGHGGFDFVADQKTGPSGAFAFSSLEAGKYKVRVQLPHCFAHIDDANHRIVTINCLESAHFAQRVQRNRTAPHSVHFEHREKGQHLAQHIDFLTTRDCDKADDQRDNVHGDGDFGSAPGGGRGGGDDDDGHDGRLSGGSIAGIVIGIAFLIIICAVAWYCLSGATDSLFSAKKIGRKLKKEKK